MRTILILLCLLFFQSARTQKPASGDTATNADFPVKPVLLWKLKTNGPIVATPVIEGWKVYIGSLDSTLYAIDLITGKIIWKIPTGGQIRSSVCLKNNRLFLLSTDGVLYRAETDSGKVDGIFKTTTGYIGDHQNDYADYFTSTPVTDESNIYFGCGDYVYALTATEGMFKWSFPTNGLVHTKPLVFNGTVYAGSCDGNIYALNSQNGSLIWKFKTTGRFSFPKGEVSGNPVYAGGMIIAGARDYNIYALDVKTGTCNWMKTFPKGWAFPVTVKDSVVYVGTSDDRSLYCLDLRSGNELWKADAGFNVFGNITTIGDYGILGNLAGKLMIFDLKNEKLLAGFELDSYKKNGKKYLKENDKFRDDIGKILKTPYDMLKMYQDLGGIFGSPVFVGDKAVVAGYDGWVYCFSISR